MVEGSNPLPVISNSPPPPKKINAILVDFSFAHSCGQKSSAVVVVLVAVADGLEVKVLDSEPSSSPTISRHLYFSSGCTWPTNFGGDINPFIPIIFRCLCYC